MWAMGSRLYLGGSEEHFQRSATAVLSPSINALDMNTAKRNKTEYTNNFPKPAFALA